MYFHSIKLIIRKIMYQCTVDHNTEMHVMWIKIQLTWLLPNSYLDQEACAPHPPSRGLPALVAGGEGRERRIFLPKWHGNSWKTEFFYSLASSSKTKRDIGMGPTGEMMLTYRATNALLTKSGCGDSSGGTQNIPYVFKNLSVFSNFLAWNHNVCHFLSTGHVLPCM